MDKGVYSAANGGVMIVIGGLLLFGQLAGVTVWSLGAWLTWRNAWPLLPIGIGLGVILFSLAAGRGAGWLVVPGAVVSGVGLILLVDTLTAQWQTWAYTWTLVVPTALEGC